MKERNRQRLARRKLTALSDDLVAKIPHNTAVPSTSIPTTSQVPEAISSYDNCASSPPEAPPRHLVWKAAPKGARRSLSSDLYNLLRSSDNDPIIKNKTRRSATSHSFPLALPDFFLKSSRRPSGSDDVCLLETFRAGESASQPPDFPCPQPPTPPPVPPRKTPFTSPSAVTEAKVSPQVGLLTFDDFKWADPTIFTPVVEERTVAHLGHVSEEGSEDENDNSAVTGDFNRKLLGPPQVTILLPSDTTENLVCPSVSSGSLASSTGSEESADSDKRQNLQTTYEPLAESLWSLNKWGSWWLDSRLCKLFPFALPNPKCVCVWLRSTLM